MSPRRILQIVVACIALAAFAVGVRGGWALAQEYFRHTEARSR